GVDDILSLVERNIVGKPTNFNGRPPFSLSLRHSLTKCFKDFLGNRNPLQSALWPLSVRGDENLDVLGNPIATVFLGDEGGVVGLFEPNTFDTRGVSTQVMYLFVPNKSIVLLALRQSYF